ncbi:hypothetical protein C1I91_11025 [Clostridium manihotivorum]|uniref:GGDEF domain-containing protein n=2 Tax=Clostridium manihotivorum TaxID=2320868 RepID=A0A410DSX5_9CLOT|nr:hypothetical protein C1I91_11025 [Clostridium manihotivorum]
MHMPFQLILLSIYFFFAALLAGLFATYAFSKGTNCLIRTFSALCLLVSICLFGYLLELNSNLLPQMIFYNLIEYTALPFYPGCWLLLSLIHTKTIRTFKISVAWLIFIIPILTFFIRFTNSIHHYFYKSMTLKELWGLNFLYLEKGPWYLVFNSCMVLYLLVSIYVYMKNYKKVTAFEKSTYKVMILASLLPFIGLVLILVNPMQLGLNYIALLLPFSLSLILVALFKYDFLRLKTLAREVLFEKSTEAMILLDNTNRIMDHNTTAESIFSELKGQVNGKTIEYVLYRHPDFIEALKSDCNQDIKSICGSSEVYFEIKILKITDDFGCTVGRLINLVNITERKNAQEALSILATTDSLTDLYNRSRFEELAKLTMERAKLYNTTFSLLMIDIDHFKIINDTYGHGAGDAVLKHLGTQMKDYFRKTDILARLGGEEFIVILPDTELEDGENLSEVFRNMISKRPVVYQDKSISFTLSIGISRFDPKLSNFDEIMKLADDALYQSKKNGRNKVTTKVAI